MTMLDAERRRAVMRAMLDELVRMGYREASVERARTAAGVSAVEFAAEFADKDECLFAAYDQLAERVVIKASSACEGVESWPERVRLGLEAVLDELASEPDMAVAITRSFPGIRPSAYQRYVELLSRFEPFMREGRDYSEVEEELPGEVELLAVGAAEAIIFTEVDAGRTEGLPRMMPEILFSVLVPFMGPERAANEMRSAATIN
jgi:AcrR family transcriptional regulator